MSGRVGCGIGCRTIWGAVVALCAFVGTLISIAQHLKGEIEKHAQVRALIARWLVMPSWHERYRDWLGRQLERLQNWMGGLWSGKALARCLAIAFAYPVALMLFGYAFGGPGTVGATEFLPTFGDWRQPVLGLGLLVVLGGMGLIIAFSERIDERLQAAIAAHLARRGVADPEGGARWRYRLGGALAAASLWLAAIYAGYSVAGAVAVALALAESPVAVAWLLFFIVLPVANALLNWPSWAISRWLGQELYDLMEGDRVRRLGRWLRALFKRLWQPASFVVHVMADLGAAFLLLMGLAVLLPFLIQLYNDAIIAAGGAAPLALREFLDSADTQPWPNAIWALAMLLTTLLPTAAHTGAVIVTLFLWLMQPTAWRQDIVAGLEASGTTAKAKKDLAWAATRASW